MPITIKEVALQAGVSVSTVSRALNGYPDVNSQTRDKIKKIATKLGYSPNKSAQILSSKKKNNVGIIISGIGGENPIDEFTGNILRGANRYLDRYHKTVAMYGTSSQRQKEQSLKDFCHEYSLDGVILIGLKTNDTYLEEIRTIDIPCVGIDISLSGELSSSVLTDEVSAFEEITEYVIHHGTKSIVLIKGKEHAQVTTKRYEGFWKAIERNRFPKVAIDVLDCNFDEDITYKNVKKFLSKKTKEKFSFICMSDLMAIAVKRAIEDLGKSIPNDYSVTGFDGIHILKYITPEITTVNQRTIEKGYVGMKLLFEIMNGKSRPKDIFVPHEFIEGKSVKRY